MRCLQICSTRQSWPDVSCISHFQTHRLAVVYKSAFKGKHVQVGTALARLLQDVVDGKIPKGSVIIVESLDRLGRETVPVALERILGILRHGIWIVRALFILLLRNSKHTLYCYHGMIRKRSANDGHWMKPIEIGRAHV